MSIFAVFFATLAVFSPVYQYLASAIIPTTHTEPPAQATVLFGGDMMFDRTVRTAIKWKGEDFVFSCLDPLLHEQDLVVANLEGPITPFASLSATSTPGDAFNMTFTFPLSTADMLYRHNIRIVNLGNNHIGNFGVGGMRSTMDILTAADVDYFGDPLSQRVALAHVHGLPIALINYNEFAGGSTELLASTTISQIKYARAGGYIPLVYTHWGIEYATTAPPYIRDLAHTFVDAGAEAVIGSHPHVVEDHELYQGKYIYYSLGNFIFDQYWYDDVRHGLLLQMTFTATGTQSVIEIPIELKRDGTTCPIE